MRQISTIVLFSLESLHHCAEAGPAAVATMLVVGDHLANGGVRFEQRRGDWRGYDIDWSVPRCDRRQQRRRQNDIAEESKRNNEVSPPETPQEALPEVLQVEQLRRSARLPRAASRAACA